MGKDRTEMVFGILSGALVLLARWLEAQQKIRAVQAQGKDVTDDQLLEVWQAIDKAMQTAKILEEKNEQEGA